MKSFIYHVDQGFKGFVYRNLHTGCWSVKALSGPKNGLVVLHAKEVLVAEPEFRVSESGRQRVLREQRKNVHAGVVGRVYQATVLEERYATSPTVCVRVDDAPDGEHYSGHEAYREVTYNPYKFDQFVYADTLEGAVADQEDESVVLAANSRVYLQSYQKLLEVCRQST
jgi:hypothetical protein